ncbi:hypothetical protein OQY15_15110 [Pedobacter sp. MC2016-15]|uniref:DUF6702 family protein n=1 Tax=Pedobacter sp. MC2016-15 TaxID=2994473 RepID=UPI0022474986|nr:DUF6702 family protein [Pedobacter sp. MC2016-15]MCX2480430.1 hypothetical protein [Pedobacter sp. MC2016-15]
MMPFLHQSLLICYLIFGSVKPVSLNKESSAARHPLHLSSTELNYNPASSSLEISCRIFTDDFEDLLVKNYKVKADLSSAARHKEMEQLVGKYMASHLRIAVNGKVLQLNYLGFENDKEAVIIYLESAKVTGLRKMETTSTILYDLFDDQTNIFHITYNGKRKSSKLTYPENKLLSTF